MCSCGPIGKERADQVLLRVPISFNRDAGGTGDVNAAVSSGGVPGTLQAVIEICHEYGRESVRRMVCTVSTFPVTSIPCFFLRPSYTDRRTKFLATQGIWPRCVLRNLRRKLDVARSNSRCGFGGIY
jgi:hypothetical protein